MSHFWLLSLLAYPFTLLGDERSTSAHSPRTTLFGMMIELAPKYTSRFNVVVLSWLFVYIYTYVRYLCALRLNFETVNTYLLFSTILMAKRDCIADI